ncbi:MAG: SLBB domain-containing protein [Alphaproteobacteria bacterium]
MRHLVITALILLTALPSLAQDVAPWMHESDHVRQYKNFRSLQLEQNTTAPHPQQYAYQNTKPESPNSIHTPTPITQSPSTENRLPSTIEQMYAARILTPLSQFGYDMFGVPSEETRTALGNTKTTPSGAVQDDFILGSGDELEILFTGQRRDRGTYTINNNGSLIIPDLPPIPASGRSIGQVRISIQSAAQNLHNTEAYVSLASVRHIGALVIGHVKRPGRKNLTVFHTVLDALMESGGIDKTGSLRQIKLIRDGRSTIIDLYALLMHGQSNVDLRLHDGDRIIVPAIGPTIAVAGEAKRPAIYEILPTRRGMRHEPHKNAEKLTLNQILEFAGGTLSPGANRFLKLAITQSGEESVEEVEDAFTPTFSDGSILMISKGGEKRAGQIELTGHTLRPGLYALSQHKTLSDLLSSNTILGQDIYPLIGIIEREDPQQLTTTFLDFPLTLVINGEYDRTLEDGDKIHLFSNTQIAALEMPALPNAQGSTNPIDGDLIDDPVLISFLKERSAFIRGAVRESGAYPLAEGITLDSILAVAGGLALEANTANIEVTTTHDGANKHRETINLANTPAANVIIESGASIRVNQKFDKIKDNSVLLMGEVQNPGRYDLMNGDKISDLIARAGGLSPDAYPYGAIFSRQSERRTEEARYKSQSQTIKQAIARALDEDDEKVNAGKIAEARALAEELENAKGAGRITIEADPAVLSVKPELDLLLQTGDRLYIPKRGLTVRVHGEVLSASALQFREGKAPLDYIHEAGGFTFHADKDRTFVLYPDGSAQPLQVSSWNYKATFIPPGSTIVVPRDPKPFDFIQSAKDVSQILSNLAVTTIFINDVIED